MTDSKRIGFYLRSATGDPESLKFQRRLLESALPRNGIDPDSCLIKIYCDATQSGLVEGPEFVRMKNDVINGEIDVVTVSA